MAIHLMEISGKLANVVFYKKYGKNFARIAPSEVKRTVNMKARNQNFGIASRNGRILRMMLAGVLPVPKDKSMQSRFSGAIAKWIGRQEIKDIPAGQKLVYLSGFQFNDKCWLAQRLQVDLAVTRVSDNMLQLQVPAFVPTESIIAPEGTESVTLEVCAAPIDLDRCMASREFSTSIEIPYTAERMAAQTIDLPVSTKRGTLIITVCALKYRLTEHGEKLVSKNPAYMPGGVVDARYC